MNAQHNIQPIHVWKLALEGERAMSKQHFELLQMARERNDFVTEELVLHHLIPEQHEEEQALEEVGNVVKTGSIHCRTPSHLGLGDRKTK